MILTCSYEEVQAIASGAELLLTEEDQQVGGAIAAPTETIAEVGLLKNRLAQAVSIETLQELDVIRGAVNAVCERLHDLLDQTLLELHPAHESAVAVYFDYAHAFAVLGRLDEMDARMEGMIGLITGDSPDVGSRRNLRFPD